MTTSFAGRVTGLPEGLLAVRTEVRAAGLGAGRAAERTPALTTDLVGAGRALARTAAFFRATGLFLIVAAFTGRRCCFANAPPSRAGLIEDSSKDPAARSSRWVTWSVGQFFGALDSVIYLTSGETILFAELAKSLAALKAHFIGH